MRLVLQGRVGQKKIIGNTAGGIAIEVISINGDRVLMALSQHEPPPMTVDAEAVKVIDATRLMPGQTTPGNLKLRQAREHAARCWQLVYQHARAARNEACGCSDDAEAMLARPGCELGAMLADEYRIAADRVRDLGGA